MYRDSRDGSTLLRDGRRVRDAMDLSRSILLGEEISTAKVIKSRDTDLYRERYGVDLSIDEDDFDFKQPVPGDHQHTEGDLDRLGKLVASSTRFKGTDEEIERLEEEIEFFARTENIIFILKVVDMIQRFRENNVVWGVGRGSSCGSFLLYVLHVNDVNPLKHKIPFHELSKEINYD